MELMNKEAKYDGSIGVLDTRRWPLESNPFKFLLMTESAKFIGELIKVKGMSTILNTIF